MRRLFTTLAAAGLLGGLVGCEWHCIHGKCDCDDGYGCTCCPAYAAPALHHGGDAHALAGPGYAAGIATTAPVAAATAPAAAPAAASTTSASSGQAAEPPKE